MFFKGKDKSSNQTVINIPCSCGTHSITISYFDDMKDEVFLSFFQDKFYVQNGIIRTIFNRIRKAFLILFGKSYRFEEIVLEREDLEKLEQEFHNILQEKEEEKENE